MMSKKDMVIFMFNETIVKPCLVHETEHFLKFAIEAHFLAEPAACRIGGVFIWARMAATRIAPKSPGMIFRRGALLQQDPAGSVEDKYRNGAVKLTAAMRRHLAGEADLIVVQVNQNHLVFHKRSIFQKQVLEGLQRHSPLQRYAHSVSVSNMQTRIEPHDQVACHV